MLNACKVCRRRLPEECFDDPDVCQVCYTRLFCYVFIVIAITNTTTTATTIAAAGTRLHVFFCDQACTRKRQSQRPQSTWAGDQVVCEVDCPVDTGDMSLKPFSSVVKEKSQA